MLFELNLFFYCRSWAMQCLTWNAWSVVNWMPGTSSRHPLSDWRSDSQQVLISFFLLSLSHTPYLTIYLGLYPFICLFVNLSQSLHLCLSLSLSNSLYLSLSLSPVLSLSLHLSLCVSIYLSACLSVYLSPCLSISMSLYLCISLSSIQLSIYLSIHPSIYLSI